MNYRKTVIILIALVLVTIALVSALPKPTLVITAPEEGGTFYVDVNPPHLTIQGIIDAPAGIKNITITDGQKSFDINYNTKTHYEFSYQFPYTMGNDQIRVIVYDVNENYVSEMRNFSVYEGIPPQTTLKSPGFIWVGSLLALIAGLILIKTR